MFYLEYAARVSSLLAQCCRPLDHNRDVNHQEQKPWLEYGAKRAPADVVRAIGKRDEVAFRIGSSLSWLAQTDQTFDFMFLNGDHSGQYVKQEIPAALARITPGGFILLHDFLPKWPGPFRLARGELLYGLSKRWHGCKRKTVLLKRCPWVNSPGPPSTVGTLPAWHFYSGLPS